MQSTCKINYCCKGNATKENLQTRKIEWTNRTYSRTIGQKWDQSNSIWMCNTIYLTFAIFSKLQIKENKQIEKMRTLKHERRKDEKQSKRIYTMTTVTTIGKKLKQKIKKFLLQQYVVKREYNAEKNHKKEERSYKLMCQNERYGSIKCEKKHQAM